MDDRVRLQKFLASAGLASRRRCEELIAEGRVKVNGAVVTRLGTRVDPSADVIEVDGKRLLPAPEKFYVMLNKPKGYVTTARDELGRRTVLDLVSGLKSRLFPVGRLDMETEGLLILTNDGEFANLLMHPRHEVWKTYVAVVRGHISKEAVNALCRGIVLEDGPTAPAKVRLLKSDDRSVVELSIREGRKRQVRRMFAALGYGIEDLKRISYGPIRLGDLPKGRWRLLSKAEVEKLMALAKNKKDQP